MAKKFNFGDRIIIELISKEIFEGDCVEESRLKIDIENVTQNNVHKLTSGIHSFYRNEIAKVYICKPKERKLDQKAEEADLNNSKCDDSQIAIDQNEYFRLRDLANEYIFMEKMDCRYYEGVKTMLRCESIGVAAILAEKDRDTTINLIILSTWYQIYIFDFSNSTSKKIPAELVEILESVFVTKVVHEGAALIDCLFHKYKVVCENVFDTQVVDLILYKSCHDKLPESIRTLPMCLTEYLNFPTGLIREASEMPTSEWKKRPLSDNRKRNAAQLTAYLLVLRDKMQKTLLSQVSKTIDGVHGLYLNAPSFEFKRRLHDKQCTQELDDLIPKLQL